MSRLLVFAITAVILYIAPAAAQAVRTFVSGHGADSGTCGVGSPCRSFAYAMTQTNPGGEITILSPAGYGAVTIDKAISIVNDGVGEAGVTVSGLTIAITINAGASDTVNLRGLTLVGAGIGSGVLLNSAGVLNIQNCVARNFAAGLFLGPTVSSQINVSDTIASNNTIGVTLEPAGNAITATATYTRVQALANVFQGFRVNTASATNSAVRVTADDSIAAGNGDAGIFVDSATGSGLTAVNVVRSYVVNNATGVTVRTDTPNVQVILNGTNIFGNASGYVIQSSGEIATYGNNQIWDAGNMGSLTPVSQQ
jgi:hypothetical protein